MLFQGIYSRLADTDVMVLTDGPAVTLRVRTARAGPLRILTRPLATRRWGVLDPKGLWRHLRLAYQVRHLLSRRDGLVHCARALPEGSPR